MEAVVTLILVITLVLVVVVLMTVRTLGDRVSGVESGRAGIRDTIGVLQTRVGEADSATHGLVETASAIRTSMSEAQQKLMAIQTLEKEWQDVEQRTMMRLANGVCAVEQAALNMDRPATYVKDSL